ncbi:NIPSNAP family protein [Rhizobium leguminosarum]|uniref:NIPSNAP family protein n=1 Tax=Rhizobium leguminosarum TaxID=384 RepID=UPI001C9758B0|nr:NIPSNAP family protein [Rhizobium leguminosarum]MBY5377285.1 hypothetical protein [Rhizobium leguminosarum]
MAASRLVEASGVSVRMPAFTVRSEGMECAMLFERRCYTFKPGEIARFWEYQNRWNGPRQIPHLLARNVGYFEVVAGPEQIVMLYRYDSFDDWEARLFAGVDEERTKYLVAGRALMLAQENMFLKPSPIDILNPVWGAGRDWLPGTPRFNVSRSEDLCIVEEITDFRPGELASYWDAYRRYLENDGGILPHLIGTFVSLVGQQHRVVQYCWYDNRAAAVEHREVLRNAPAWKSFTDLYREGVVSNTLRLMRTARVPWMRNLFEPMAPTAEGGRDAPAR